MKNVALYVRVSTQEQKKHGLSVDSQIVALQEYAAAHDYTIAGIYNDAGISARKKYTKRPALLQLMNDCQQGKIDLILFTKLDRWFRSVGDYYEVQNVLESAHVPWRAIWEDYETETSSGIFKVNIMLSVAQSEADRTSERIKTTFDYKRAKGDYIGTAPFGYMRKDNKLVKNPEQAEAVKIIFDTYLKTHSLVNTMQALIDNNVTMSQSGMVYILKSETYAGNAYGFACEPYITMEQHKQIAEIRKSKFVAPKRNNIFIFGGLCRCAICGCRVRVSATKNYCGYVCPGTNNAIKHRQAVRISERRLEQYMLNEIESIMEKHNQTVKFEMMDSEVKTRFDKKKSLEAKLNRIGVRFEEGDISADEYRNKRSSILAEIASIDAVDTAKEVSLPDGWYDIYVNLDKKHKQQFWFTLIKEIELSIDKEPKITFN